MLPESNIFWGMRMVLVPVGGSFGWGDFYWKPIKQQFPKQPEKK